MTFNFNIFHCFSNFRDHLAILTIWSVYLVNFLSVDGFICFWKLNIRVALPNRAGLCGPLHANVFATQCVAEWTKVYAKRSGITSPIFIAWIKLIILKQITYPRIAFIKLDFPTESPVTPIFISTSLWCLQFWFTNVFYSRHAMLFNMFGYFVCTYFPS
jgi:hypothetical protein